MKAMKNINYSADGQFCRTKAKQALGMSSFGRASSSNYRKDAVKCVSTGRTDMSARTSSSKSSRRHTYDIVSSNRLKYPKEVQLCADYTECSNADYVLPSVPLHVMVPRNAANLEHFQKSDETTLCASETLGAQMLTVDKLLLFRSVANFETIAALPAPKSSHNKNESNTANKIAILIAFFYNLYGIAMDTAKSKLHREKGLQTPTKISKFRYFQPTASYPKRTKFRLLPGLGATSLCTLITLVCLETLLLSTVTSCAKTFYMHWNTSNSIFRIDNTDHIIDVNKGNLAFEFDQVHIICPVYEPGTYENETEKYIIYNVSKVEYETCRITNADPRVIAICDKPQKLMFFTITFRPFTPQPGGLEFLPGNDYYFISTSSKDDLYRRIGGRCSTNNMKVVFKVCCAPEDKNKTNNSSSTNTIVGDAYAGSSGENNNVIKSTPNINQQSPHLHNMNTIGISGANNGMIPNGNININNADNGGSGGVLLKPMSGQSGTSINTNIDQFNRIPIQTNGNGAIIGSGIGLGNNGGNGIMLTPGGHNGIHMIPTGSGIGIGQYPTHYPGHTGIRINNVATQHHPSQKSNNNDDHQYDKHPNEVVKNEELTYNSATSSLHQFYTFKFLRILESVTYVKSAFVMMGPKTAVITEHLCEILELVRHKCLYITTMVTITNPTILISLLLLLTVLHCFFRRTTTNIVTEFKVNNFPHCGVTNTLKSESSSDAVANTAKCSQSTKRCFHR